MAVSVTTLDAVLGGVPVAVLKLDVEGYERVVLEGAADALGTGRIRHIVFEDHAGPGSPVSLFLASMGYSLFSIGWAVRGLNVIPSDRSRIARAYEAPSYLATLDAAEVSHRCRGPGWRVLSTGIGVHQTGLPSRRETCS